MKFNVHYNYWTKNSSYPTRCSRFVELPRWSMTEAKNQLKAAHGNQLVKVEIFDHKAM
ncbi:MAG: hypothetical protein MJ033_00400 [Victivallaceae bacterium]|nr:hypothetical protein [Victivallaceae bacterium]